MVRGDEHQFLEYRADTREVLDGAVEERYRMLVVDAREQGEETVQVLGSQGTPRCQNPDMKVENESTHGPWPIEKRLYRTDPFVRTNPTYDLIIIGSGPSGLTAAIYATRANLKTLVIAGAVAGGQLMLTSEVENYPGFPDGVLGPELMSLWRKQAERFKADFVDDNVTKVDFKGRPFKVWVTDQAYEARAVIISTGANAKYLNLPNEERLKGRGVSACATCDGFFFKQLDVVVVGGGDTAMEEALYLSKLCKTVTVVHRRHEFRASKIMQERLLKTPNVKVVWDSEVVDVLGETKVEGVRVKHAKTGATTDLKAQGLFLAIGHAPATEVFKGQLQLDKDYIVLHPHDGLQTSTNVEGVFAAGDVHDHRYRQAVTAAGFGCMAALDVERWLQSHE